MLKAACQSIPDADSRSTIGLLVSVRSVDEFRQAACYPVEVLDFKEPQRGALAAADPQLWQQAAEEAPPACRLSAALGEWEDALKLATQVPARFSYAKAGPAGAASTAQLVDVWAELQQRLPRDVELVAVAYADHQRAQCPPPEAILQAAVAAGLRTWLIDTFDKTAGCDSLTWLGSERLYGIQQMAEQAGVRWVLAGSIGLRAAQDVIDQGVRPDLFGVRGAICDGTRSGEIVPARIGQWLNWLGASAAGIDHADDRQRAER